MLRDSGRQRLLATGDSMSAYVESNLWRETAPEAFSAPALEDSVQADLVIVGGGFTGCSAALHAARLGMNVRLLEAETIAHGGSGRNVGLVNAGLWMPPDDIIAELGQEVGGKLNEVLAAAPDLVFGLIEAHGIECHAVRNGTLHCAHAESGVRDLENRLAQQEARGAPVRLLDAAETRARTGTDAFHASMFDQRAGTVEPCAYCRGLARAAVEAGALLHEHSPVREIERDGAAWRVRTGGGAIVEAPALLVATNAYHQPGAGIAEPAFTPVHFFQFATHPLRPDQGASILPGGEGCWDTGTVMSAFRRDADGRVVVGSIGALDHGGAGIHRRWARRKLARMFPHLADEPFEYCWHGRIAMTADHLPRIVRPGPGALVIFGYSGRGIGPGTAFGKRAAEALASGDDSELPLPPQDTYDERWTGIRRHFFEFGSLADHTAWMMRSALHR
jgi:glycine/D-amino acid oxidase-like deaminating enzyme